MSRALLLAAAATLSAAPATAQFAAPRLEVDPALRAPYDAPIPLDGSRLIASDLSEGDFAPLPGLRAEYFRFTGHAGDVVSAQVKTDMRSLQVAFGLETPRRDLVRGLGSPAPLRFVLPRDGTYLLVVDSRGGQRYGKYELEFRTSASPPAAPAPVEPKPAAPVQVAATAPSPMPPPVQPKPAAQPAGTEPPKSAPAAPAAPAGPSGPPPLPKIPGVLNAQTGKTLSRPAAAKPGPGTEMFQFLAAGGADLQVTASGSGKLMLTLYTIDGEEIVSASGADILRLDAIAPRDDLYFLSVWRADGARPYRLNLAEKQDDPLAVVHRYGVGFEQLDAAGKVTLTTCWGQPGVKRRDVLSNGTTAVATYLGDGRTRADVSSPGKPPVTVEWTYRLEGDAAVQTFASGRTATYHPFNRRFGAYRGYLCK